jgi:hypothetical protein
LSIGGPRVRSPSLARMKGWPSLVDGAALLARSGSHRRGFESLTLRQAVVAQPGESTDLISRGPLVRIQPSARSTQCPRSSVDRARDYGSRCRWFDSSRGLFRDVVQFGSASGWGPEGRRFESGRPDSTGTSSAWESAAFGTRRSGVQFPRTQLLGCSAEQVRNRSRKPAPGESPRVQLLYAPPCAVSSVGRASDS